MIDKKRLIEDLKKHFDAVYREDGELLQSDHVCTAEDVDNLIALVNSQPKVGEWIPCSERLPEESLNSVLGWDEYRERCVFVQYYRGRWILGNDEGVKIIAWMPLPEPYKEEK